MESAVGRRSEKRKEERLKQIQNVAKVNLEELDAYLELRFLSRHNDDLEKISVSLSSYRDVIKDAFRLNHKRGFQIWMSVKGLAFTLVYILRRIEYPFQIDILENIAEIKELLFNAFWATEIQSSEAFSVLKLCVILLVIQRKATTVTDVIFEYERYQEYIASALDAALLLPVKSQSQQQPQSQQQQQLYQQKHTVTLLYLYKIFTAVAFAMYFNKYDVKAQIKVFSAGSKVFMRLFDEKVIDGISQTEVKRERVKAIHCYFEFQQKHLKLLEGLRASSALNEQQLVTLHSECVMRLHQFEELLEESYYEKIANRLQVMWQTIAEEIKRATLSADYFQDDGVAATDKSQSRIEIGQRSPKSMQKGNEKKQQSVDEKKEQVDTRISAEQVSNYVKQFMLKKFTKQPNQKDGDDGDASGIGHRSDNEDAISEEEEEEEGEGYDDDVEQFVKKKKKPQRSPSKQEQMNKLKDKREVVAMNKFSSEIPVITRLRKKSAENATNVTFQTGEFGRHSEIVSPLKQLSRTSKEHSNQFIGQLPSVNADNISDAAAFISHATSNDATHIRQPKSFNQTMARIFNQQSNGRQQPQQQQLSSNQSSVILQAKKSKSLHAPDTSEQNLSRLNSQVFARKASNSQHAFHGYLAAAAGAAAQPKTSPSISLHEKQKSISKHSSSANMSSILAGKVYRNSPMHSFSTNVTSNTNPMNTHHHRKIIAQSQQQSLSRSSSTHSQISGYSTNQHIPRSIFLQDAYNSPFGFLGLASPTTSVGGITTTLAAAATGSKISSLSLTQNNQTDNVVEGRLKSNNYQQAKRLTTHKGLVQSVSKEILPQQNKKSVHIQEKASAITADGVSEIDHKDGQQIGQEQTTPLVDADEIQQPQSYTFAHQLLMRQLQASKDARMQQQLITDKLNEKIIQNPNITIEMSDDSYFHSNYSRDVISRNNPNKKSPHKPASSQQNPNGVLPSSPSSLFSENSNTNTNNNNNINSNNQFRSQQISTSQINSEEKRSQAVATVAAGGTTGDLQISQTPSSPNKPFIIVRNMEGHVIEKHNSLISAKPFMIDLRRNTLAPGERDSALKITFQGNHAMSSPQVITSSPDLSSNSSSNSSRSRVRSRSLSSDEDSHGNSRSSHRNQISGRSNSSFRSGDNHGNSSNSNNSSNNMSNGARSKKRKLSKKLEMFKKRTSDVFDNENPRQRHKQRQSSAAPISLQHLDMTLNSLAGIEQANPNNNSNNVKRQSDGNNGTGNSILQFSPAEKNQLKRFRLFSDDHVIEEAQGSQQIAPQVVMSGDLSTVNAIGTSPSIHGSPFVMFEDHNKNFKTNINNNSLINNQQAPRLSLGPTLVRMGSIKRMDELSGKRRGSLRNSNANTSTMAFQAFLLEEQLKELKSMNDSGGGGTAAADAATATASMQSPQYDQQEFNAGGTGSNSSQLRASTAMYNTEGDVQSSQPHRVTIASNASEKHMIHGQTQRRMPMSLADFDFDQYSLIVKEQSLSPSVLAQNEGLNVNSQVVKQKRTSVSQILNQLSQDELGNTHVHRGGNHDSATGSGGGVNSDAMNAAVGSNTSILINKSKIQNEGKRGAGMLKRLNTVTAGYFSKKGQVNVNVNAPASSSGSSIHTATHVASSFQRGSLSPAAAAALAVPSSVSHSMISHSITSMQDALFWKNEKLVENKPKLQNLLNQLQMERKKSEMLKEISTSVQQAGSQMTIKQILGINHGIDDHFGGGVRQTSKSHSAMSTHGSNSQYGNHQYLKNSNSKSMERVQLGDKVASEADDGSNAVVSSSSGNLRQQTSTSADHKEHKQVLFMRQRSFFYKQKQQEELLKQQESSSHGLGFGAVSMFAMKGGEKRRSSQQRRSREEDSSMMSSSSEMGTSNKSMTSLHHHISHRGSFAGGKQQQRKIEEIASGGGQQQLGLQRQQSKQSEGEGSEKEPSINSISTPKRLLELKSERNIEQFGTSEPTHVGLIGQSPKHSRQSSKFMLYKTSGSSKKILENQIMVSKNFIDLSSVNSGVDSKGTQDYTNKFGSKKKSNFSEEVDQFQRNQRVQEEQQKEVDLSLVVDKETSIVLDLDEENSEQDNEEKGNSGNQAKEENLSEHKITFYPSAILLDSPNINRTQKRKLTGVSPPKKSTGAVPFLSEETEKPRIQQCPMFKFVRFILGIPMVLTIAGKPQPNNSSAKEEHERRQNTKVNILLNGQMLYFAQKDKPGQFLDEITLEIDNEVKSSYFEAVKQVQSKKRERILSPNPLEIPSEKMGNEDNDAALTIWPLLNIALEVYLRNSLPKVYMIPEPSSESDEQQQSSPKKQLQRRRRSKMQIKDIIQQYNLFCEKQESMSELVTEFDLKNIGSIKDKINQLVKHYGKRVRKDMGTSFFVSNEDQSTNLVLVSLRKYIDRSCRVYQTIVPFYKWEFQHQPYMLQQLYGVPNTQGKHSKNKPNRNDSPSKRFSIPTSCIKEPSYRKTENYYVLKHIKYLNKRLLKIIQSPPIILSFMKKDEAGKMQCITVRISFKPGSENIKGAMFTNFSFYILGKNIKTLMNSTQPLDIHIDEIIEHDPSLVVLYKVISRFTIYDKIPRRWSEFLISYFNRILLFTSHETNVPQNYTSKLDCVFSIVKRKQMYVQTYNSIEESAKCSEFNNVILRNIIFREVVKREDFITIFDEKFKEVYKQHQSLMRPNIHDFDFEDQFLGTTKELREAEIEQIRLLSQNRDGLEKRGPNVVNLSSKQEIELETSAIIFSQPIFDEHKLLAERLTLSKAKAFREANRIHDRFCNSRSPSIVVWRSTKDFCKSFYVTLNLTETDNFMLTFTSIDRNESYSKHIRGYKQQEILLNIFNIVPSKQSATMASQRHVFSVPSVAASPSPRRSSLMKPIVGQRKSILGSVFSPRKSIFGSFSPRKSILLQSLPNHAGAIGAGVLSGLVPRRTTLTAAPKIQQSLSRGSVAIRGFLLKTMMRREMTFQGMKIVTPMCEERLHRSHLSLESLNMIKDHLLLNHTELLRFYESQVQYFIRNAKTLGKTSIIMHAFRLSSAQENTIDGQQCLFLFKVIPYYSRSKLYQFVLNYSDLMRLNPDLAGMLYSAFDFKAFEALIEFVIQQFSTLRTYLGRTPIFSFMEKEEIVGTERQVSFSIKKDEGDEIEKVQRLFPELQAKKAFQKMYKMVSGGSSFGSFHNRRRTEQVPRNQSRVKIRYLQNRFYKNEYEFSKHSKSTSFLEDATFQHRIIAQQPKLFANSWALITVSKDVLGQKWDIRIYIPKTSRTISCKISPSDFESCSSEFIMQCITQKITHMYENPRFQPFADYSDVRMRAKQPGRLLEAALETLAKVTGQKTVAGASSDNRLKQFMSRYRGNFMVNRIMEQGKLNSVKKIYKINKFFEMTKELDESFQVHLSDIREEKLLKFMEIEIWTRMLSVAHFRMNHASVEIYLHFGSAKLPINELVLQDQYKISDTNEFSTEIYIDLIKTYYNPSKTNKLLKEGEERKEFTSTKNALVHHYFNTMEYLPYEQTSRFKFQLINYSIHMNATKTFAISLREILNLYVAEGFSKLQTGQTNSKVTYRDLKEVCAFIIFKIKTQNFLDLAINDTATVKSKPVAKPPAIMATMNSSTKQSSEMMMKPATENRRKSVMNQIMSNPRIRENLLKNDRKKSAFAPAGGTGAAAAATLTVPNTSQVPLSMSQTVKPVRKSQEFAAAKRVNFNLASKLKRTESMSPSSNEINSNVSSPKTPSFFMQQQQQQQQQQNMTASTSSFSSHLQQFSKSPLSLTRRADSIEEGVRSPQNALAEGESAQAVYIHDIVVDVKNRIIIRVYFHVDDATFIVKLFQCGTASTLTRFLHFNYFAKKDLFFTQYLQAELYDEIVERATKTIKKKMYMYFCIQHQITPIEVRNS